MRQGRVYQITQTTTTTFHPAAGYQQLIVQLAQMTILQQYSWLQVTLSMSRPVSYTHLIKVVVIL